MIKDVNRLQVTMEQMERLIRALEDLKETIVLSAGTRTSRGFRIGIEGESVYYDFTEGAIAEALRECISPRLREILDPTDG